MTPFTKLLVAAAPALLMAACGGGDDSLDDRLDLADPKLRLVHAVPLAPDVSLFRDDVAQAAEVTGVAYKGASNYFDIPDTASRWDVRTATTPALAVGSVTFNPTRGTKYTLIAVPDAGSLTTSVLVADPYNKGVDSNSARVRIVNAAFNAANMDAYLVAPGTDIAAVAPTFAAVGYKQAQPASGADSIAADGGNYRLLLTNAGTKTVVFSAPVDLLRNADWLLVPVPAGFAAGDVKVLIVKSDEGAPAVEITNAP